jgi:hypothetical protein
MTSLTGFSRILVFLAGLGAGCRPTEELAGPVRSAEFGVFFGGQVQERDEIPFELDRARQSQGFRLEFTEALNQPVELHWEIHKPPSSAAPKGVVELGQTRVAAGQTRYEHALVLQPGDPLGVWNVRVLVDERPVLDRAVSFYDVARRKRAVAERRAQKDAAAPRGSSQ